MKDNSAFVRPHILQARVESTRHTEHQRRHLPLHSELLGWHRVQCCRSIHYMQTKSVGLFFKVQSLVLKCIQTKIPKEIPQRAANFLERDTKPLVSFFFVNSQINTRFNNNSRFITSKQIHRVLLFCRQEHF